MNPKLGWSLAMAALFAVTFLLLDCTTGKKVTCLGRVTSARYEAARDWTSLQCHQVGKGTACSPIHQHEPEHYWAYVSTPLGTGQFDDRNLYTLAPHGHCEARFSMGRWSGHLWGPTSCEPTEQWPAVRP